MRPASAEDKLGQGLLDALDVGAAPEFAFDGIHVARDVNFHLGIHVKGAGGFDREVRDRAVGDRVVLGLFAGKSLLVDQDQALIGEDKQVTDDFETTDNFLAVDQDGIQVFL